MVAIAIAIMIEQAEVITTMRRNNENYDAYIV